MIKNIVFDMGRVLIRWEPEEMLKSFSLSDDQRARVYLELFQNIEWIRLDRGTMTPEQVYDSVCQRLPVKLHSVVYSLVHYWHRDFLIPVPGMKELISELKNNGYHIYLLSNASPALRGYFPRIPGSEFFDGLMVSGEELLLKPEHEIYERLYERFSLDPSECWFIDDHPPNIEGALQTGMRGSIFRGDVAQLRKEMTAAGICCSVEDSL